MRRLAVDWQTWGLLAALLAGMVLELLIPGTPLSSFLLIPVVASAALGRPALTASMAAASLVFAILAQRWLGYDVGDIVRRSLLITLGGVVGCLVAASVARTMRARAAALTEAREDEALLRTVTDTMLDAQILLQPVRDGSGHITDFTYADVNRAACGHLGLGREDLIGQSLVQTFPNIEQSGLLAQYARCAQTGDPIALDDFRFFNGVLGTELHYNIRGSRTPQGRLSLTYQDVTERFQAIQRALADKALLRASVDSMLDPQMLLEAVRDPAERIVDFRYLEANAAACKDMVTTRDQLIGKTVLELLPNFAESGLIPYYAQCLETGQPGALDDYTYDHEIQASSRRYDIRVAPAGKDLITLTFRDVTERFRAAQRIAASEERYRLLAENATDIVCHVRDGAFVWVSPSIEPVLGAPPEYWLGHQIFDHIPPEDAAEQAALVATAVGGGAIKHRGRVIGVDGVTHWFDLRAKPFYDAGGNQDGVTATLRLVDEEVAAEHQIEEARRERARSDALYRRSVDSAAVGMCLADLEGNFVEANKALCEFFGYDAETLRQMNWQELTDPDYRACWHKWGPII